MRIMYGVCGEGMGHAVRAQPVIEWLRRRHEVVVVAGDRAYDYLCSRFPKVHKTVSMRIIYRDNRVANFLTSCYNVARMPLQAIAFARIIGLMMRHRPQVLVCDFDHLTNWAANLLGIPVISFDNEMIILRARCAMPSNTMLSRLKTLLVARFINPRSDHYLVSTFFIPRTLRKNTMLCQPVLRVLVEKTRARLGKHFLVYQTSISNTSMLRMLRALPSRFIIYGFNKNVTEGNCTFRTFSEKQLISDLAACRGVITNGGFTLITEALRFGKPIISIPIKGQYEQELNAFQVELMGVGICLRALTPEVWNGFTRRLPLLVRAVPKQCKQLQALPTWQRALNTLLEEHSGDRK